MRTGAVIALCLGMAGCEFRTGGPRTNAPPPQGYPQQGQYPPSSGAPPPAGNAAPSGAGFPASAPVTNDPINGLDLAWLRSRAGIVMKELVAALPDAKRQRVSSIPLGVDDTPGEVNAFAACLRGNAVMVVADGLLDVTAFLARARANDEVFGTQKVSEYCAFVARNQKPGAPIQNPPLGFFPPSQETDGRRVARAHEVFDEVLGFVLGHEIAHHYLGHLPCTGASGPLGMGDIVRGVSGVVPLFNQPNELGADIAGTSNVLVAGTRRQGHRLTENGGLLLMQFFSALDQMSPVDILFSFERTHPPPAIRVPAIQQAANYYRATGATLPVLGF